MAISIVYGVSNVGKIVCKTGGINDIQLWLMGLGIAGVVTYFMGLW